MKLGRFAIGYGVLVIVVGSAHRVRQVRLRVRAGEVVAAQAQLLGPLLDMLVFAPRSRRPSTTGASPSCTSGS